MATDNPQLQEPTTTTETNPNGSGGNVSSQQISPEQIFGEYANEPSIQKFKNPQDLAKSYLNLEKLLGKQRIPIPEKPEDYEVVYDALGRPQDPNEYEIPEVLAKEIYQGNDEALNNLKGKMHKLGFSKQQANELLNWYTEDIVAAKQQYEAMANQEMEKTMQALQQEWGDAFEERMQKASAVYNQFSDETKALIDQSGLGRNKEFIDFMYKMGNLTIDGNNFIDNPNSLQIKVEDAKAELSRIMGDRNHPYYDKYHPEHNNAVKAVEDLYKIIYGKENT